MDARLRQAIAEAMRRLGLDGDSVNLVIADGPYFDRFHLARGLKEDGSGNPEASFKTFGGGLSIHSIEAYVDGNLGFGEMIRDLDLKDRDVIRRLGAAAEGWEEGGPSFTISPRELDKIFLVMERHVPDADLGSQGKVHRDFWFGVSAKIFEKSPILQENEIHSSAVVSIHEIERPDEKGHVYVTVEEIMPDGERVRRRVRVSPDHASGIHLTYKKIRGEEISLPIIVCKVVERGGYCVVCKKRGDPKDAKRRGVDVLHVPRERPAPATAPEPIEEPDESPLLDHDDGYGKDDIDLSEGSPVTSGETTAKPATATSMEEIRQELERIQRGMRERRKA